MAAIDCTLAHLLGHEDVLVTNRNIYGGAYQLIHDWYAKPSNLNIAVESFDGYRAEDLEECLTRAEQSCKYVQSKLIPASDLQSLSEPALQ